MLGNTADGYIVTTEEDRHRLLRIINNMRGQRPSVYLTSNSGNFDFSHALPDPSLTTLLDVLTFEDELVRNLLIDTMRIEGTLVVKERHLGDDFMRRNDPRDTKIFQCLSADCYRLGGV